MFYNIYPILKYGMFGDGNMSEYNPDAMDKTMPTDNQWNKKKTPRFVL